MTCLFSPFQLYENDNHLSSGHQLAPRFLISLLLRSSGIPSIIWELKRSKLTRHAGISIVDILSLLSYICTFDDKLPTVNDALRLVFIVKTFGPSIAIRVVVFYFKFIEANNLFYSSVTLIRLILFKCVLK